MKNELILELINRNPIEARVILTGYLTSILKSNARIEIERLDETRLETQSSLNSLNLFN